jgi:hypothetical protein
MIVPWFKVHARNIESFHREGDRTIIGLDGNSQIDVDWKNKTYSVAVDGVEISRDASTFCPLDGGRIAFYSNTAQDLSAALPANWERGKMAAFSLSPECAEEVHANVDRGKVKISVPARQPVMVYRDGANARKRLLQKT